MPEHTIRLRNLKTYSIKTRRSKIKTSDFAKVCTKKDSFGKFLSSLPDILAALNFKKIVKAIISARKKNKPVIFMLGAHVIKCGLNPLIIDLIKKKIITCVAINGAGMIHDFEIAFLGKTSEDVGESIKDGSFGMAKETAEYLNDAIKIGAQHNNGIGNSVGRMIREKNLPNKNLSILYNAREHNVPVTVHVAIGTDIIHMHPSFDGAQTGRATQKDFHILIEQVSALGNGGVVINIGSAVMLPEVFLKALSVARNLKYPVKNFVTANFDMVRQYRPLQNVVIRPTLTGGEGYDIVGHHEIMIPLLHRAIIESIRLRFRKKLHRRLASAD